MEFDYIVYTKSCQNSVFFDKNSYKFNIKFTQETKMSHRFVIIITWLFAHK